MVNKRELHSFVSTQHRALYLKPYIRLSIYDIKYCCANLNTLYSLKWHVAHKTHEHTPHTHRHTLTTHTHTHHTPHTNTHHTQTHTTHHKHTPHTHTTHTPHTNTHHTHTHTTHITNTYHTHTHTHTVGLLWRSDQPIAEAAAQHTTNPMDEHPGLLRDSNPRSQ